MQRFRDRNIDCAGAHRLEGVHVVGRLDELKLDAGLGKPAVLEADEHG
jgi:hypothetical protein